MEPLCSILHTYVQRCLRRRSLFLSAAVIGALYVHVPHSVLNLSAHRHYVHHHDTGRYREGLRGSLLQVRCDEGESERERERSVVFVSPCRLFNSIFRHERDNTLTPKNATFYSRVVAVRQSIRVLSVLGLVIVCCGVCCAALWWFRTVGLWVGCRCRSFLSSC